MNIALELHKELKNRDSVFLINKNKKVKYRDVFEYAKKISLKISPYRNVGICFNDPELFTIAYLAVGFANSNVVLINNRSPFEEVLRIHKLSDCALILTDRVELIKDSTKLFSHQITDSIFLFNEREVDFINSILIPTSGTNSNSKIVRLSHENILNNAASHNEHLKIKNNHKSLVVLPQTSSFAHTTQFISQFLVEGINVYHYEPFFPFDIYKLIEKFEVESIGLVESQLKMISKFPPDSEIVKSLIFIIIAGGMVSERLMSDLRKQMNPVHLLRAYGLTEAGPRVSCTRINDFPDSSSGVALPGVEIKIKKHKSNVGEIFVRSNSIMTEYYQNPKLTNYTVKNNWLRTGDVGYVEDSKLFVIGRIKNAIKVAGFTVYPEEVEEIIGQMDQVKDVYVYGSPDPIKGEKIIAVISMYNKNLKEIDKEIILKKCLKHLSWYKIPSDFEFINEIKKNSNGKTIRMRGGETNEKNVYIPRN